ncbi:MAG: alpha/beta hydrolase [Bacteroidota bacterium]
MIIKFYLTFIAILLYSNQLSAQDLIKDFEKINKNDYFIFYLHGRIIEEQGINAVSDKFGAYKYEKILAAFESSGFQVLSEARKKNTDPIKYAGFLTGQIQRLISSGVSPENITVVGASKGSLIAMLTSSNLQHNKVNFVILASCNDWVRENFDIQLCGRVLSIYDQSDDLCSTCEPIFQDAKCELVTDEIKLNTGKMHGLIYQPYKAWIEPTMEWARPNSK